MPTPGPTTPRSTTPDPGRPGRRAARATSLLALVALGTLGLRDASIGVAWPSMRTSLHRPLSSLGVVLLLGTAGYLLSGTLSGPLRRRWAPGPLLAVGATSAAAALAGVALSRSWAGLLAAAFVLGLGNGLVDTGVNTHVALGSGIGLMGLVHASYGIGAAGGPLLVSALLAVGAGWRAAYAALMAVEAVLATGIWLTRRAWGGPAPGPPVAAAAGQPRRGLLALTLAIFFVYTGLELAVGAWGYTLLTAGRHLPGATAAGWVAGYWAALTGGRLLLGATGSRVAPDRVLAASVSVAAVGTLLTWWSPTPLAGAVGLPVTALGLAAVFPSLVALTPARLGPARAPSAIGLQLASAALGGAVVAAGAGLVAGRAGVGALGPYLAGCGVLLLALNTATTHRAGLSVGGTP